MAEITITIPDEKVPLILNAIRHRSGQISMTAGEASDWIKDYFINSLKKYVLVYQREVHAGTFVADNLDIT